MKKLIVLSLAIFVAVAGHSQITVTLGSAQLQNPGTIVHLPVTVKGLNALSGGTGVTGIELHIAYSNTSLVYDTTLNFSVLTPSAQWYFGANGIEYSTNWLEPSGNKLNIPDNTVLFDIVLQYLGGSTELAFDTVRCLLIDSAFNIIPGVHYVNGHITPSLGSGESRWNGSGQWNTLGNWSNGIPGDSTNAIIETGEVTVLSNVVCKTITINPGSTVNLSPGFSLTANKDYINNGNFNLQSDATGTGSLIVDGMVSGTGMNKFSRYLDLSSNAPSIVSSPVYGGTAAVFGSNPVEKYLESTVSWVTAQSSGYLETGLGYRISGSAPATFTFQGSFSTGNITLNNLSYNASGMPGTRGLNLLGNPYPSAIQWEQGNWVRTGLDDAVYVWNGYKYVTWNGSIGDLKDGIIPAMQGFFVKSNTPGAIITIPAGSRLHSTLPFYKLTEAINDVLSMRIENTTDTNHFDEAFVHVLSGSTSGYDNKQDAWKLTGNNTYPQIYTKAADQAFLSINTQPDFVSVPVEYTAGFAGSYKLTFGNIESFDPGQPLFFEDKVTNTVINIRNSGMYVFTSEGTPETGRFILHFREVGLGEHTVKAFSVWNTGNAIHIQSTTGEGYIDRLEIYNITGQLVCSINDLRLPATIPQENLQKGLYILRIKTKGGIYTQKLLVGR